MHRTRSPPLLHPSRPADVLAAAAVTAITGDIEVSVAATNRTAEALIDRLNEVYLGINPVDEVCRILNRLDTRPPDVITPA